MAVTLFATEENWTARQWHYVQHGALDVEVALLSSGYRRHCPCWPSVDPCGDVASRRRHSATVAIAMAPAFLHIMHEADC